MTGRIVLIEDDPDIAALVADMLSEAGHQVDARSRLPDVSDPGAQLVITDLLAMLSRTSALTFSESE